MAAPDQSTLGGQQQEAGGTASRDAVLYGIDPRDVEEERELVALLREQNEARRCAEGEWGRGSAARFEAQQLGVREEEGAELQLRNPLELPLSTP